MKRLMMVLTVIFVFSISAFAQMGAGQDGGMMDGGWGWGMGYGWGFGLIIVILAAANPEAITGPQPGTKAASKPEAKSETKPQGSA